MATPSVTSSRQLSRSFFDIPSKPMPEKHPRLTRIGRWSRRVALVTMMVVGLFGVAAVVTPTSALAGPIDDIKSMCGPLDVKVLEVRGSGIEAILPQGDPGSTNAATVVLGGDQKKAVYRKNPPPGWKTIAHPSYERYGLTGLSWNAFGDDPGCFDMNRLAVIIPNFIFTGSKAVAGITFTFIAWAFSSDPFSFLEAPIAALAKAISTVMMGLMGLIGVLGVIYLVVTSGGRKVWPVVKGIIWMVFIVGTLLWFKSDPTVLSSTVNNVVGDVTSSGFSALSNISNDTGATADNCGNDTVGNGTKTDGSVPTGTKDGRSDAAKCIQDALWIPLVYQPWLFGETGVNGSDDRAALYAPMLLNGQYIGEDPKTGKPDTTGQKVMDWTTNWNAQPYSANGKDKHERLVYEGNYASHVPYLRFWATDACHIGNNNFSSCWSDPPPGVGYQQGDEQILQTMAGNNFGYRIQAALLSVGTGLVINLSVWYLAAMLLIAKLGLYVLLVFTPIYLILGMFPGPQRVAAFSIGELILTNIAKQAGWAIALVMLCYLYVLVFSQNIGWFQKVFTVAALTILAAIFAKPAGRALSGLAAGNRGAGQEIVGVGTNAVKQGAEMAAMAGLAVASGGTSLATAAATAKAAGGSLGLAGAVKAAGMGIARSMPNSSRVGAAIRGLSNAKETGRHTANNVMREQDLAAERKALKDSGADYERDPQLKAENTVLNRKLAKAADLESQGYTADADKLRNDAFSDYERKTGRIDRRDTRLASNGGDKEATDVRTLKTATDIQQHLGMSRSKAAKNLDRVADAYNGNTASLDPTHETTPELAGWMARRGTADEQEWRQRAEMAVAKHGLPNQVGGIGLAEGHQVMLAPEEAASAVVGLNAGIAADLADKTPAERQAAAAGALAAKSAAERQMAEVQAAQRAARTQPAGSPLNRALNNYATLAGDTSGNVTAEQLVEARGKIIEFIPSGVEIAPTPWIDRSEPATAAGPKRGIVEAEGMSGRAVPVPEPRVGGVWNTPAAAKPPTPPAQPAPTQPAPAGQRPPQTPAPAQPAPAQRPQPPAQQPPAPPVQREPSRPSTGRDSGATHGSSPQPPPTPPAAPPESARPAPPAPAEEAAQAQRDLEDMGYPSMDDLLDSDQIRNIRGTDGDE